MPQDGDWTLSTLISLNGGAEAAWATCMPDNKAPHTPTTRLNLRFLEDMTTPGTSAQYAPAASKAKHRRRSQP